MSHPMHEVLARWKAAFDSHQPDVMAELFTSDALFQGFGPVVVAGRDAVRAYYEAVADDRRADVTVLHTYSLGDRVAGGFADVTFSDPAGWEANVHMSLVLQCDGDDWQIRQYHVSRTGRPGVRQAAPPGDVAPTRGRWRNAAATSDERHRHAVTFSPVCAVQQPTIG
ncbi:YybH family protein [Streptomyces sp. NPDC059866]|uniref:YybH family protein n=1 Tax=Streptomyces sp. NPDC059866 TaxID=3346978 RepID=UPI00365B1820